MLPRLRGRIRLSAASVPYTTPRYVTSVTRSTSPGSSSLTGEKTDTIALFTQTSIGPSSRSARSAAASTADASATSVCRTRARPPSPSTSRLAPSRPSMPRAISPTSAPLRAKARTIARPSPAEAPVTTTTGCFCIFRSSCARTDPRSLLALENPRHRADQLLPQRAAAPSLERFLVTVGKVVIEIPADASGKAAIAGREVHLIVMLERPVVDVGGADNGPDLVDEERLHVRHTAVVLVDVQPRFEQLAVHAPARQPHPFLIGQPSRNDHGDLHAALGSPFQRATEGLVREEVGRRDQDALGRRFDQQLKQHARDGRSIGRGALDHERGRRSPRLIPLEV